MAKLDDVLVKTLANVIRGWRRMSRRARILIFGGAGFIMIALVTLLVFMQPPAQAEEVLAQATPVPTAPSVVTPSPTPVPTTPPEESVDVTLQHGDENENVSTLQGKLMDLGYLDIDESSGYYGPATEYAVKLFQRQYSLAQDGIAGYETQMLLYANDAQYYTILTGTSGDDVTDLQQQLIDLGYLGAGKATGYYGDETTAAVKAFQKANDLSADGKTGENTLNLIYSPNAIATPEKRNAIRTSANVEEMIAAAEAQLGDKYILGHEGPNSFDCSGLVYYCLKQAGSNRGRYNAAGYSQVSDWDKITRISDLKRGDLIFYWDNAHTRVGHVGIYIGNGMMIDASSHNGKVVKRKIFSSGMFVCGRRPW